MSICLGRTFTSVPQGILPSIVQAVTLQGVGSAERKAYAAIRGVGRKAGADFAVIEFSGFGGDDVERFYEMTASLYKKNPEHLL